MEARKVFILIALAALAINLAAAAAEDCTDSQDEEDCYLCCGGEQFEWNALVDDESQRCRCLVDKEDEGFAPSSKSKFSGRFGH